jgi:hypothetical protein
MKSPSQETILAAYIATTGKRIPLEAAQDATELCQIARSLRQLSEIACNSGLSRRQQKRLDRLDEQVKTVLERAGLRLNHLNGDPRGYAVYIDLPDGYSNAFGGREHGYGIG